MGTPEEYLVDRYLEEIARSFNVPWKALDAASEEDEGDEEISSQAGGTKPRCNR
jgi:hypothetical protein